MSQNPLVNLETMSFSIIEIYQVEPIRLEMHWHCVKDHPHYCKTTGKDSDIK